MIMKVKIINKINLLLTTLVGMLGFSCCLTSCNMYGVPSADFFIEGRVINEEKKPLEDIQVMLKDYWESVYIYTQADGTFQHRYDGEPTELVSITVKDTSGVYQSVTLNVTPSYTGGKKWYRGSDQANIEFVLKKNEE